MQLGHSLPCNWTAVGWPCDCAEHATASSRAKLATTGQRVCRSPKRIMPVCSHKAIPRVLLLDISYYNLTHNSDIPCIAFWKPCGMSHYGGSLSGCNCTNLPENVAHACANRTYAIRPPCSSCAGRDAGRPHGGTAATGSALRLRRQSNGGDAAPQPDADVSLSAEDAKVHLLLNSPLWCANV